MKSIAMAAIFLAIVGCRGSEDLRSGDTAGVTTGASSGMVADTAGGAADTGGTAGTSAATGAGASSADTSQNQTQSGVTDTKTGASTLGPDLKKVEPTQGEAVTSKGDTVKPKQP